MINKNELTQFIQDKVSDFHQKRLDSLQGIKLKTILRRKNPYLYKAKDVNTAQDIVKAIFDAHLSSQEETIFGNILEQMAIYVAEEAYNGYKSSANGIDLEIKKGSIRYLLAIKSGPNWGNKSQIDKMKTDFNNAKRTITTSGNKEFIECINGCCYGKDSKPNKGNYQKLCGQLFWEFISGEKDFYIELIEPLGHKTKDKNEEFNTQYYKLINTLTHDFYESFCEKDGSINWTVFLKFNSEHTEG